MYKYNSWKKLEHIANYGTESNISYRSKNFLAMAQQPLVGQSLLIIESSWSPSDTPHSVGLLRKSDQPDSETSTWNTQHSKERQTSMPPAGFEPTIPASERQQIHALDRSATDLQ